MPFLSPNQQRQSTEGIGSSNGSGGDDGGDDDDDGGGGGGNSSSYELWHCWLGDRKGIQLVKDPSFGIRAVVTCLELCTF